MHRARPVPLLLVSLSIAIVGAGCPVRDSPNCALVAEAVAADSRDTLFVAARRLGASLVWVIKRNASGEIDWKARLSADDDTPVRVRVPPSGGGVVVFGGGAAATRFDDAGEIISVVGYPTVEQTYGTLTSDDRVVLADAGAVRMFERDGSASWALSLPDEVKSIADVAADSAGGAWLLGEFSGSGLVALLGGRQPDLQGGNFLIHFDRDGGLVGGQAWLTGLVISELTGGEPLIARGTAPAVAMPDFALPADPTGFDGPVVLALDRTGTAIWARRESLRLVRDGQGDLFSVAVDRSALGTTPEWLGSVARWDAAGEKAATTATFTLADSGNQTFHWYAGPAGEGAVVVGTYTATLDAPDCEKNRNVLVRVHADLTFEQMPLELP